MLALRRDPYPFREKERETERERERETCITIGLRYTLGNIIAWVFHMTNI